VGHLIVNADDFGLTAGVNRAIDELHRAGVLTSATLMANAAASADAVRMALIRPTLGVGCHIVLVDGAPVLPPRQIPTLVDRKTGLFKRTLGEFLQRLFAGLIGSEEIEAESAAQISLLQSEGLALTHVDTHKHIHMFPTVLRPVLRATAGAGIRAIRNPFEPAWSLRATRSASWPRRTQLHLLRQLSPGFRKQVAQAGLATTDGVIGVLATGSLDAATVDSLLKALPPGAWELIAHPGYNDADLAKTQTRLMASRETERVALNTIKQFPEIDLICFADLRRGSSPVP
jgi:hopanoid biosynthesis associated protein HpnK